MNQSNIIEQMYLNRTEDGQANINRVLVIVFFLIYGSFAGIGSLLLFRAGRRRIAVYISVVVVGASLLAGLLGGVLRSSRGDLSWMTVTHPGAGGAVQFGRIDIQSAGGRDERVSISGNHPDLQLIDSQPWYERRYSYQSNRQNTVAYSPFTWQPNLAKNVEDAYQVNAPITPWGSRELQATAFNPGLQRMDFELEFEPAETIEQSDIPSDDAERENDVEKADREQVTRVSPQGVFSLKLASRLPFDMTDGWLVIGVTSASADNGQPVDVYQIRPLPAIPAGGTHEEVFDATFNPVDRNTWQHWHHGRVHTPRLSRLGTASAWFAGHIESSPGMAIDEERCDFVPRQQYHVFVQEILPEDMPDPLLFYDKSQTPTEAQSAEEEGAAAGSD
jgi:hypothetical protein